MNYFYGPVPSRRLGYSLGVDVIPAKRCSFDCLYCQVGETSTRSARRFSHVSLKDFRQELEVLLAKKPRIDYITFSGSGEPTLHRDLDKLIKTVKRLTKGAYPVCVITNASLLYRPKVRQELQAADVVIPSLDAGCAATFAQINKPCSGITFKRIVEGIVAFRKEFAGSLWLEIMIVKGVNDSIKEAQKLARLVSRIKPEKVELNIPVRPSHGAVALPERARLARIKEIIGSEVTVISPFSKRRKQANTGFLGERIAGYVRRRPATVGDLSQALGVASKRVRVCVRQLVKDKKVATKMKDRALYVIGYDS